jgi:hypothetical protein
MSSHKLAAAVGLVVAMVACGGGSDPNPGAGGSTGSPTGGSTAAAGSAMSGGGSSGSGVSGGGAVSAGHCTPGTPKPAESYIGDILDTCPSVSGLTGDVKYIYDIALTKPVGPGQTFAFSVDLATPAGDYEMYGATRECGDVGELLSTVHVTGNGVICHEVKPVTGTYNHMIWVWRVVASMKDTAVCESGVCPAH